MNNVKLFIELIRLKKPIGYMLLFWPCAWGLTLAYDFSENLNIYFFDELTTRVGTLNNMLGYVHAFRIKHLDTNLSPSKFKNFKPRFIQLFKAVFQQKCPNDPINGGNHNHKGFSVFVVNDTIWVGTANGINKGIINSDCINWVQHINSESNVEKISGNWVVGFHNQKINEDFERFWAITWAGASSNEKHGLSYTDDGGITWTITSPSKIFDKVYNLYSFQGKIWAASESGLYISEDAKHWEKYSDQKIDSITGEKIFSESVLASVCDEIDNKYLDIKKKYILIHSWFHESKSLIFSKP